MNFVMLLNNLDPDLGKIVRIIERIRRNLIKRKCSKLYLNKCYIYIYTIIFDLFDKMIFISLRKFTMIKKVKIDLKKNILFSISKRL